MPETIPPYEQRIKWFHEARFGMFIHFGLYSLFERGEWVMLNERIPAREYARLARRFRVKKFDASAWAATAAAAGAKYTVITTRHHEGFCLFDSKVSDFTSAKTAAKRDFVGEYADAARKAGLKVGFYYSLLDWRFPGYFEPQKYPDSARALVEQAHAQVRELMTNYGKIDIMWYDGGWSAKWDEAARMSDFWRAKELNDEVRHLQPHILVNNRSGLGEDLDTPEQHVKASEPGRGWETCMTMGDSCGWGYIRNNPNMKTVPQLLQHLVTAAAGEGNFLLNVGPKPDGTIRKEETSRLAEMGKWLSKHGEAIYGSQRSSLSTGMIAGPWTRKGNVGYLNVFRWPGDEAVIPLVATKAMRATILETGQECRIRQEHNGRLVISGMPKRPPHPYVNVIKVEFEGEPRTLEEPDASKWLTRQGGQS